MKKRSGSQSRQSILAAAGEVFSEKGYARTTIREVASRADISVGGIYLYFRNKEELYTGLMREQMDAFSRHTAGLRDEEPLTALKALFDCYLEYAARRTKMLSMNVKEYDLPLRKPLKKAFFTSQRELVAHILRRGREKGVFGNIDCEETAEVVLFSIRGAFLAYLSGEIRSLKRYGDILFEVIIGGIKEKER